MSMRKVRHGWNLIIAGKRRRRDTRERGFGRSDQSLDWRVGKATRKAVVSRDELRQMCAQKFLRSLETKKAGGEPAFWSGRRPGGNVFTHHHLPIEWHCN